MSQRLQFIKVVPSKRNKMQVTYITLNILVTTRKVEEKKEGVVVAGNVA